MAASPTHPPRGDDPVFSDAAGFFRKKSELLQTLLDLGAKEHDSAGEIARDYLAILCDLSHCSEAALIHTGATAWLWDNLDQRLSTLPADAVAPGVAVPFQMPSGMAGNLVLRECGPLPESDLQLAGLIGAAAGRALDHFSAQAHRLRRTAVEHDREQVLKRFLAGGSVDEALNSIAALIGRHAPHSRASVLSVDGWAVECVAAPELPVEYRNASSALQPLSPASPDDSMAALRCAAAVHERARHMKLAAAQGYPHCESAPLTSRSGEMIGLLLAHCSEPPDRAIKEILRNVSRVASLVLEHRRLAIRSQWAASHDRLTGLGNREALYRALESGIAAARQGGAIALIFISLDRFRNVNGGLGHTAGDLALRRTAERIRSILPEGQIAMRPGGDEFAVVLTGCSDEDSVVALAQAIRNEISSPFKLEGHQLALTCRIGISTWPAAGDDPESLLRHAELAMWRARDRNSGDIVVHSRDDLPPRFIVERGLQNAIARNELDLRYQPLVTVDGSVSGFEALLSWNHPEFGQIPANHFIPIAEEADLIVPIGEWVLRRVCAQASLWRGVMPRPLRFWVNVSARQFARSTFAATVSSAIADSGIDSSSLVLELTETAIMRNIDESRRLMSELRETGVRLAIDDFGSGYSSLNYLWTLPVHAIKIDQSFVRSLASFERALAVIQTLVGLGHALGLDVVAEGVESEAQFDIVRKSGCNFAQGYLFAGALPVAEADALIRSL